MAILGQWLGFDTTNNDSSPQPQPAKPQPGIVISSSSKDKKASRPTNDSDATLKKTKSDEILRDFDVMRFLCRVDERLHERCLPLQQPDLDRLQTFHAQASADNCTLLIDIIDHLELENDKLRHRLAVPSPNSAAADAIRAQRNRLVC